MRFRYEAILVLVVLGIVFGLGRCGRTLPGGTKPHVDAVLPKDDTELVTENENNHTVTITTAKGTATHYSRDTKVEIQKNGTVKIDTDAWGVEAHPFLGVGYSDTARVYFGCNLFYIHSFDAAASFGLTANGSKPAFQPMLSVGWNFYSNTSLNVGINPLTIAGLSKPEPALFISVRL